MIQFSHASLLLLEPVLLFSGYLFSFSGYPFSKLDLPLPLVNPPYNRGPQRKSFSCVALRVFFVGIPLLHMGRGRRTRLRAQGYTKKHELRRRRHPRTKTVSRHTKTANPAQSTDEEQTRNSRAAWRKNQETQLLTSSSVPARLDHPCQCQAHGAWCPARATDLMRAPLEHPFWHKVQDTHECSPTNETDEIGSGHVLLQILQDGRERRDEGGGRREMGRGRRTRLRAQGYTKKHELRRRRRHPRTPRQSADDDTQGFF